MSIDVLPVNGTDYKPAERPNGPCPDWCEKDFHLPPPNDDGVHCSEPLATELSTKQDDQDKYVGPGEFAVLVGVQHHPGRDPFVMLTHHDGHIDSEDPLTATEAVQVAEALEWNAEVIRACGNNTCWCDGNHQPREEHWGECKKVAITLTSRPYIPEISIAIVRGWYAPAALIQLNSHTEKFWDLLTPDEAEQLAKHLRRCAAIIAVD